MRTAIFITFTFFCFMLSNAEKLKKGDLIFQAEGKGEFSKAISSSTSREDSLSFVHVGIIDIDEEGGVNVIEASPKEGVRIISLKNFLLQEGEDSPGKFVVKRLCIDFPVEETIERAKSYLGQPYDWWYLPDNGKMYCSELVWESFQKEDGERIFKSNPMNFRDKDGNMPEFWIKLYQELGQEVPEGIEGTNPNDLSRDKRLVEVIEE